MVISPELLTVEDSIHYPGSFVVPNEFEDCSFYLCEELSWNFDGNCIEFVGCFWYYGQFY